MAVMAPVVVVIRLAIVALVVVVVVLFLLAIVALVVLVVLLALVVIVIVMLLVAVVVVFGITRRFWERSHLSTDAQKQINTREGSSRLDEDVSTSLYDLTRITL